MRLGILLSLLWGACLPEGSMPAPSTRTDQAKTNQKRLELVSVRVLGESNRYQFEGFFDSQLGSVCEPLMLDRPRCVPIDRVRLGTYWADPNCTIPVLLVRTIPTTDWGYYEVDGEGQIAQIDPSTPISTVYRSVEGRCEVYPTTKLATRYRTLDPSSLVPIYRYAGPQ